MNFCGIQINPAEQAAILSFALYAASELIGMSKLKENSLVQVGLGLIRSRLRPTIGNLVSPSPVKKKPGRPPSKRSSPSSRSKA